MYGRKHAGISLAQRLSMRSRIRATDRLYERSQDCTINCLVSWHIIAISKQKSEAASSKVRQPSARCIDEELRRCIMAKGSVWMRYLALMA